MLGDLVPDTRLKDAAMVRDNRVRAAKFGKPVVIKKSGNLLCIGHGVGGD